MNIRNIFVIMAASLAVAGCGSKPKLTVDFSDATPNAQDSAISPEELAIRVGRCITSDRSIKGTVEEVHVSATSETIVTQPDISILNFKELLSDILGSGTTATQAVCMERRGAPPACDALDIATNDPHYRPERNITNVMKACLDQYGFGGRSITPPPSPL